jgi:hypothetical protein
MIKISICTDLEEARRLWQFHWPQQGLFDLWPVRNCFQLHYNYTPMFIVATRGNRFCGMVALSWIEEMQGFAHFPGETWQGKTWLEQNRILAADDDVFKALAESLPPGTKLRYLLPEPFLQGGESITLDEDGYLFSPASYDFSFDQYLQSFRGKSRKKLFREIGCLTSPGVSYRYDSHKDVALLFRMNLENFKEQSYFSDRRFLQSFENLSAWLQANGLLRTTTVLIGGKIAAVDIGAVYAGTYTVMAGATNPDFPGVAKLINLHHIEWACQQRLAQVDFLCGDFNWKSRFHLTSRPLYELVTASADEAWQGGMFARHDAVV